MAGKDYKVYLSSDGTDMGTETLIEDQGDLNVRPGKPLNRTAYKDGSKTALGNEGWSATFSMGRREPLGTGQALVFDAMENDGKQYMWIKSGISGGIEWSGPVKITVTDTSDPVSGEPVTNVEMSEDGTIARGTTS